MNNNIFNPFNTISSTNNNTKNENPIQSSFVNLIDHITINKNENEEYKIVNKYYNDIKNHFNTNYNSQIYDVICTGSFGRDTLIVVPSEEKGIHDLDCLIVFHKAIDLTADQVLNLIQSMLGDLDDLTSLSNIGIRDKPMVGENNTRIQGNHLESN